MFGHNWGVQGNSLISDQWTNAAEGNLFSQWIHDISTSSTFSGTVGSVTSGGLSATLTLTSAATGQMWNGEVIGCAPFSLSCKLGSGTYIQSLLTGTWGASGSTYNIVAIGTAPTKISAITSAAPMTNAMYYTGPGGAMDVGPFYDQNIQAGSLNATEGLGPHGWSGQQGIGRIGRRIAALLWGALTTPSNASASFIDRVKADATGCDTSATVAPCFDIGNTFATTATATAISSATLTFNGLASHTIPISAGQAVSCISCTAGLFVVSVSNPPTADARAGLGQWGTANNGFTVTLNAAPGVTGSGHAFTFGCKGTAGTGSNCIDIAFTIPTVGTYGTTKSLATCGENNQGGAWVIPTSGPNAGIQTNNAPPYNPGNGICQTNGIGSLVRNFVIGSNQSVWGGIPNNGGNSTYDDGAQPGNATGLPSSLTFIRNDAFTCHIASATVVQCVLGPNRTTVATPTIGQWSSGSTYVEYGDNLVGNTRIGAIMGFAGGQSFPITSAGSGQTTGLYTATGVCPTMASSGTVTPKMDITVGSGGTIIDAYLSASTANSMGRGIGSACTFTPTGTGGTAGSITVDYEPFDGFGGVEDQAADNNLKGDGLYDNTMIPGNPLSSFQHYCPTSTNYCEPGLATVPFGLFLGAQVGG